MDIIVSYLVMNFMISVLATERLMGVFFENRRTPLFVLRLSYISYFAVNSAVFLLFNTPMLNISSSILATFIITLNYKSMLLKKFFATLCIIVLFTAVDFLSFFAQNIYPPDIILYGIELESFQWLQFILTGVFAYLLALLIRRFKNIKTNAAMSPSFWVSTVIIPIASLFLILLGVVFFSQYSRIIVIIYISVIMIINGVSFYFHDALSAAIAKNIQSALHAQEKEYYQTQLMLMQESVETVRSIKHDIKAQLNTVKDFSTDSKAVVAHIGSLIGEIEGSELYSNTGNLTFDSVINFKLKNAKEDNIKLDLRLFIPPVLSIEIADVVTILGNLLDNALDAVAKVEDKYIKLDIKFDIGGLFIVVENSFHGEVKYKDGKVGVEHIESQKGGKEHGYGLKNIRKAAEKYNGHVDICHKSNLFSVGVLLYMKEA